MDESAPAATSPPRLFGPDPARARLVVLLLHGRTQTPQDMNEMVVKRMGLTDIAYLAPEAPDRSWYPERFMQPLSSNLTALNLALGRLHTISDGLTGQGIERHRLAVVGFSQGACLACEFVWRQPRRLHSLLVFTGGLLGPQGTVWTSAPDRFDDMPVLMTGRDQDPWVPLQRAEETARAYRAAGARVVQRAWPGSEHEIADDEIALARQMLA